MAVCFLQSMVAADFASITGAPHKGEMMNGANLHGEDYAPAIHLMAEDQVAASHDLDLDNSTAPWASGMRDLNLIAQAWCASQPGHGRHDQSLDAWTARGKAANKMGLAPTFSADPQSMSPSLMRLKQCMDDPSQLFLTADRMDHKEPSQMPPLEEGSAGLTPTTISTPSSNGASRHAKSMGDIADLSQVPIWLRRLNCDYTQARLRGQSAPDLPTSAQHSSSSSEPRSQLVSTNGQNFGLTSVPHYREAQTYASFDGFAPSFGIEASGCNGQYQDLHCHPNTLPPSHLDLLTYEQNEHGQSIQRDVHLRKEAYSTHNRQGTTSEYYDPIRNAAPLSPKSAYRGSPGNKPNARKAEDGAQQGSRNSKGSIAKVAVRKRNSSAEVSDGGEDGAEVQLRHACPHPGCNKHFSTSGHARRHSRVHDDLRPYECPHADCHATFTRRDNCTQHQRARHGTQLPAHRLSN